MTVKKGMDQVLAWILAVISASVVYGVGYGVFKIAAAPVSEHDGEEISAEHSNEQHSHGSETSGHTQDHDEEPDDEHDSSSHGEAHGAASHEEHGAAPAHDEHGAASHEEHGAASHEEHGAAPAHEEHGAAPAHDEHGAAPEHDEHGAAPAHDEHGKASNNAHAKTTHEKPGKPTKVKSKPTKRDIKKSHGGGHAEESGPQWNYKGSTGPAQWASLSEAYQTCKTGRQQSPIDIDGPTSTPKLLPIKFHYYEGDTLVENDGRTVMFRTQTGNFIEVDGDRYDLQEFHFHAPSEHKVVGAPYDLEMHLTHKDAEGHLLIVGVLFEQERANKALMRLWKVLPEPGERSPEPLAVDPTTLLPSRRHYYAYNGSLANPPCTEGVKWLVLTDPVSVSSKQIEEFTHVVSFNARPVQALNGRKVVKSTRS